MDLKDIKAIIDLMKKNSISEFELERQDFKIKLKRGSVGSEESLTPVYVPHAAALPTGAPASLPAANLAVVAPPQVSNEVEIKSPMIGTLY